MRDLVICFAVAKVQRIFRYMATNGTFGPLLNGVTEHFIPQNILANHLELVCSAWLQIENNSFCAIWWIHINRNPLSSSFLAIPAIPKLISLLIDLDSGSGINAPYNVVLRIIGTATITREPFKINGELCGFRCNVIRSMRSGALNDQMSACNQCRHFIGHVTFIITKVSSSKFIQCKYAQFIP